jgi:hypothetical protein
MQRVEILLQPLLRGFTGVHRAAPYRRQGPAVVTPGRSAGELK